MKVPRVYYKLTVQKECPSPTVVHLLLNSSLKNLPVFTSLMAVYAAS